MKTMPKLSALALTIAALVVAGCGDDDKDTTGQSSGEATPAQTSNTGAAEPQGESEAQADGTTTVEMKDIAFEPKAITVKVGDKIVWRNKDSIDHDVVAEKGASFKSETFGAGGTFEYTTEKAGEIDYVCTLHPGMDGTITVTE